MPRTAITSNAAPPAIGPYSQAVRTGDLLFVSGQIPLDPATGRLVEGDVSAQTHRVLQSLDAIVRAAGATLDDICDMTVYLLDIENHKWPVREVRSEFFDDDRLPVSTMIEVRNFAIEGMLIEIDAIAAT